MTNKPFGVLLGADSLLGRRSGIGRYTIEIAQVLRKNPSIAALGLMMEGKAVDPAILDFIPDYADCPDVVTLSVSHDQGLVRRLRDTRLARQMYELKLRYHSHTYVQTIRKQSSNRLVYHEPNMIPASVDYPTVATIHDLSWLHHRSLHPEERLKWLECNLSRTLGQTTRFVAVSQFTAREFTRAFGVAKERIDVIPNAASTIFKPISADDAALVLRRYGLYDQGYILSASTLEPRKNLDALLRSYLRLPQNLQNRFPLVIVGGSGWGRTLDCPEADAARSAGKLRLLGHIPDRDLAALYARSAVFAYVSLYEGFGLPVIEAMAAGAPVIASSTTGTAETAADAALLVDPTDESAISSALQNSLEDPKKVAALVTRGLARAACFSWERTARALIETWQVALENGVKSKTSVQPTFAKQEVSPNHFGAPRLMRR